MNADTWPCAFHGSHTVRTTGHGVEFVRCFRAGLQPGRPHDPARVGLVRGEDRVSGRYWLTPPELQHLKDGRFDPYPFPHEFGDWNALLSPWKKPWYANPPFHHLTKHVRRAIEQGGPGIFVMPIGPANALVLQAGLTMEYLGRVSWIDPDTGRRGGGCHCVKVVFP